MKHCVTLPGGFWAWLGWLLVLGAGPVSAQKVRIYGIQVGGTRTEAGALTLPGAPAPAAAAGLAPLLPYVGYQLQLDPLVISPDVPAARPQRVAATDRAAQKPGAASSAGTTRGQETAIITATPIPFVAQHFDAWRLAKDVLRELRTQARKPANRPVVQQNAYYRALLVPYRNPLCRLLAVRRKRATRNSFLYAVRAELETTWRNLQRQANPVPAGLVPKVPKRGVVQAPNLVQIGPVVALLQALAPTDTEYQWRLYSAGQRGGAQGTAQGTSGGEPPVFDVRTPPYLPNQIPMGAELARQLFDTIGVVKLLQLLPSSQEIAQLSRVLAAPKPSLPEVFKAFGQLSRDSVALLALLPDSLSGSPAAITRLRTGTLGAAELKRVALDSSPNGLNALADAAAAYQQQVAALRAFSGRGAASGANRLPELVAVLRQLERMARAGFVAALSGPLNAQRSQVAPLTARVAEGQSGLLYSGQVVLPVYPARRVARIYLHDRGSSAAAANRARYVVCLQYSAASADYQEQASGAAECETAVGYVGLSVELATLERTAFVVALSEAIAAKNAALGAQAAALQAVITPNQPTPTDPDTTGLAAQQKQVAALLKEQLFPTATAQGQTTEAKAAIGVLEKSGLVVSTPQKQLIEESLRDLYDDYLRREANLLAAPRSGVVLLGERLYVYDNIGTQLVPPVPKPDLLLIDSVQMEVEDGNAVDIKAHGTYRGDAVLFETFAPIGLSTDYDLQNSWYRQWLWVQSSKKEPLFDNALCIRLDELMRYYPLLTGRTSDRSPVERVYTFHPADALSKRTLLKESTTKILQARVFTDLNGIRNDNPNGLIQLEADKKFVLNNKYSKSLPNVQWSFANYLLPNVTVSKVEEANRHLRLTRAFGDSSASRSVHTINLLRYSALRVGVEQNLVTVRIPRIKSDFSLDLGVYLHRVPVSDSIPRTGNLGARLVDSTLNVVATSVRLNWRIRPDPRYGLLLRLSTARLRLMNEKAHNDQRRIVQMPGTATRHNSWLERLGDARNILQYEMMAWARVSESAQFFLRTRLSHLWYQTSRTFFQLQLGAEFDVFTTQRSVTKPASLLTP